MLCSHIGIIVQILPEIQKLVIVSMSALTYLAELFVLLAQNTACWLCLAKCGVAFILLSPRTHTADCELLRRKEGTLEASNLGFQ